MTWTQRVNISSFCPVQLMINWISNVSSIYNDIVNIYIYIIFYFFSLSVHVLDIFFSFFKKNLCVLKVIEALSSCWASPLQNVSHQTHNKDSTVQNRFPKICFNTHRVLTGMHMDLKTRWSATEEHEHAGHKNKRLTRLSGSQHDKHTERLTIWRGGGCWDARNKGCVPLAGRFPCNHQRSVSTWTLKRDSGRLDDLHPVELPEASRSFQKPPEASAHLLHLPHARLSMCLSLLSCEFRSYDKSRRCRRSSLPRFGVRMVLFCTAAHPSDEFSFFSYGGIWREGFS